MVVCIIVTLAMSIYGILALNEASEAKELDDMRQKLNSTQNDLNILKKQVELIDNYRNEIIKVWKQIKNFLYAFDMYCELKDKDESFWPWDTLSDAEREFMIMLKDVIGINEIPCQDIISIKHLINTFSKQALKDMLSQLRELTLALHEMNTTKMQQLQQKHNDENLSNNYSIENVRLIISRNEIITESWAKRIFWGLINLVKPMIPKFAMLVVNKLFE